MNAKKQSKVIIFTGNAPPAATPLSGLAFVSRTTQTQGTTQTSVLQKNNEFLYIYSYIYIHIYTVYKHTRSQKRIRRT